MSSYRLILGLVSSAILALTGCGHREHKPPSAAVERLPRLETVEPVRTLLPVRIELSCTVEPLEKADLCARVPGVVAFVVPDIDIGRRVAKDEKLIELDVPDLHAQKRQKEALLEQARRQKVQVEETRQVLTREVQEAQEQEKRHEAEHAFFLTTLDRITKLVATDSVTRERQDEVKRQLEAAAAAMQVGKAQTETKRAKLEALKADLHVAQSRIEVAEADLHNISVLIGYATLRAPFDGVITRRWVDRGAMIKDASAPLLTVVHADTVRILLDMPERHVPLVNATEHNPNEDGAGDLVTVRIPALAEVGQETRPLSRGGEFTGHVTRVASVLDPVTRTMRTEVHLDNRGGHLRPGMTGTATVLLDERYNALTIPSTALVRRGTETEIFYVADLTGDPPRGTVCRARVELGLDDGQRVEIRSSKPELDSTFRIIAKGNGVIRDGDVVYAVPLGMRERKDPSQVAAAASR